MSNGQSILLMEPFQPEAGICLEAEGAIASKLGRTCGFLINREDHTGHSLSTAREVVLCKFTLINDCNQPWWLNLTSPFKLLFWKIHCLSLLLHPCLFITWEILRHFKIILSCIVHLRLAQAMWDCLRNQSEKKLYFGSSLQNVQFIIKGSVCGEGIVRQQTGSRESRPRAEAGI